MAQINRPSDYFNTLLWTGNGTDNRAITGVGFQPDWVWIKSRSNAQDHALFDFVRGANKQLVSNSTGYEVTRTDMLKSFDSDGFTLGDDQTGASVNYNGFTYVGWNWLAGGTAVSNTDGSITSSVSANTTSGFSIVTYTGNATDGATVGHGLGSAPKVVIVKSRSNTENWNVYHSGMNDVSGFLELNTTGAKLTNYDHFNATAPTSTVFSLGATTGTNGSGYTYIAYCFAEKKGFSKFGSYTGNGSTDGTFVYTGFKPAWLLFKNASASATSWIVFDAVRNTFNYLDLQIRPNDSTAEIDGGVSYSMDFLSNGFKVRSSDSNLNGNGNTMIYMAFASEPLTGSNGVPCTAR